MKESLSSFDKPVNKNRTAFVGTLFSGKTHSLLEILSRKTDRDIYIFTKSPPGHYSNCKVKIEKIGEEIQILSDYQNAIKVFDDVLGT